ncbi:tetratricopeptide repeat protein 1 [Phtheirospermum japonicum]|uniref:Tetratricopeptide repeat protein 1 n=1 Tax=Phtheirospermum japonicum TaxID=374723 RepID=A0A830BPB1_9LAMI|nr:tetratricopeptide repeat protein 1 [Phtheirospermum japonicum]
MGKHSRKNKKFSGDKSGESHKASETSPRVHDKDTAIFILMSRELKDEGNRLFQKRDYEGAMLKYEKALSLLPRNHIDISYLRSNMAACYMQLGISEYPKAIHECNLSLEVTPKYSKALLKRARCYEALNKLDLALRDVGTVLKMEQNNLMAIEIAERVKNTIVKRALRGNEFPIDLVPLREFSEPPPQPKVPKEKAWTKKIKNAEAKKVDDGKSKESKDEKKIKREANVDFAMTMIEEKTTEDKLVLKEEKISTVMDEEPRRTLKLVFGEDIRWAQIPVNCNVFKLREIISVRFPRCKAVLVKYRDEEGDLVTITTTEELRLAESSVEHGFVKLYIVETSPDQDPFFNMVRKGEGENDLDMKNITENGHVGKGKELKSESVCISDWILQFAQVFKNYAGFDSDACADLREVGMKLSSDDIEETVTSEEAQGLFCIAAEKFQEMAASALFNWGKVHMSKAKKKVHFAEDYSTESLFKQVKSAYDLAQTEYAKAGKRYEEALKIKPNFYEAVIALGQQQFEQAKLSWYYAIGTNVDLETWPSRDVLELYKKAEENMEKGMQMWKDAEEHRVNELSQTNKIRTVLQKMKLDNVLKHVSADEAAEQAANIQSQIHVLWGTILYERSIMQFKLRLPAWQECLEVAVEKFELAGASSTHIAVMIKNHCCNDIAPEGLGFNINEIVQAWNEMYEAEKWRSSIQSFRLEPLLRRRVSKLYYALEHA